MPYKRYVYTVRYNDYECKARQARVVRDVAPSLTACTVARGRRWLGPWQPAGSQGRCVD